MGQERPGPGSAYLLAPFIPGRNGASKVAVGWTSRPVVRKARFAQIVRISVLIVGNGPDVEVRWG